MSINEHGLNIIKSFEGLELKSYKCPAKITTIGYGTTLIDGKPVPENLTITEEKAEELLKKDLLVFEKGVSNLIKSKINSNQFSAIVSMVYNIGIGNFKASTILKKVNANPTDKTIKDEFLRWNKAGGKVLNGLIKRREAEAKLYFS